MNCKAAVVSILCISLLFFCSSLRAQQKHGADKSEKADTTLQSTGKPGNEEAILENPDVPAQMDSVLWRMHLRRKMGMVIMRAAKAKVPADTYRIRVRFVVEKDGRPLNALAQDHPGYGLATMAENIVLSGPKWKPAEQNGQVARSYRTQTVTFVFLPKSS